MRLFERLRFLTSFDIVKSQVFKLAFFIEGVLIATVIVVKDYDYESVVVVSRNFSL